MENRHRHMAIGFIAFLPLLVLAYFRIKLHKSTTTPSKMATNNNNNTIKHALPTPTCTKWSVVWNHETIVHGTQKPRLLLTHRLSHSVDCSLQWRLVAVDTFWICFLLFTSAIFHTSTVIMIIIYNFAFFFCSGWHHIYPTSSIYQTPVWYTIKCLSWRR